MNPLFTLGEEFRFHDSRRFRKKAGCKSSVLPQFCASFDVFSCGVLRAESVHLLNFVTPDDSARNRKMRKMMSLLFDLFDAHF